MKQRTIRIMFALLRSAVLDEKLSAEELNEYSPSLLEDIFKISRDHDLSHLIAYALKQNGLATKEDVDVEKHIISAVYRYERIKHEYENICASLEKAKIPFLPLKGSVIRKYYPEEWMRTSCDIDVLVKREDCEKAKATLSKEHGYTYEGEGSHDLSLISPSNVHVELHYGLIEEGRANYSSQILNCVWDTARVKDGFSYFYEMPDELFYFYHVAHMAKHFVEGGCGARTIVDLWILDNIQGADHKKRDELLSTSNLLKFASSVRKLSKIWFENQEYDAVSKQLEDYVLRGGVYGNNENYILVQQQKKGGRVKYVLSKIFIPYDVIKYQYPILQKHPYLTPVMEVRRWFKLIFCGHFKRVTKDIKYNNSISQDKAKKTQQFLNDIGL